jgi:DNA-binding CsgD family transcriptional regulator
MESPSMAGALLEREDHIAQLVAAAVAAHDGRGGVVFVSGEAGAGKTSTVRAALDALSAPGSTRPVVLAGHADPVATPTAFGPLHELVDELPTAVRDALRGDGPRAELFSAVLEFLVDHHVALIVEDVQWADDATLDLLLHLGRRMAATRSVLVCTFRSDEVGRTHPLRRLSGALAGHAVRVELPPLSFQAVAELVNAARLPATALTVFASTHGNPFFVREVLAHPTERVPARVEDAVLARTVGLPATAWSVLDAVVLSPDGLPTELARMPPIGTTTDADIVLDCGLVVETAGRLRCSHDLVRMALDDLIAGHRRVETHRRLLELVTSRPLTPPDVAAAAAHAIGAGDRRSAVEFSVRAGRYAAERGAHHQAARHFTHALEYLDDIDPQIVDDVMRAASYESYLTNDLETALVWARRRCDRLDDPLVAGDAHRWLSRVEWFHGETEAAHDDALRAVELLDRLPASYELALATSNMAQLAMLDSRATETERWANRALELAERFDADDVASHAKNNLGTVLMETDDQRGELLLREALTTALDGELGEHAARAFTNLGFQLMWRREIAAARSVLDEGIAYCDGHELDSWVAYMSATRAIVDLTAGDVPAAIAAADELLTDDPPAITRQLAVQTLATWRLRSDGDGGLVDEHRSLATALGDFVRLVPAIALELERAWTQGVIPDVDSALELVERAVDARLTWSFGHLAFWLRLLDDDVTRRFDPDRAPAPVAAALRGDWSGAADHWKARGCVVESALCRARTLDREDARSAIDDLLGIGARSTASAVRRDLAAAGMRSVPRGARSTSHSNPVGLTTRQLEILERIAAGDTNAEIARRLVISPKTVGHHVSAVLAKLGVATRRQAAATALEHGWVHLD